MKLENSEVLFLLHQTNCSAYKADSYGRGRTETVWFMQWNNLILIWRTNNIREIDSHLFLLLEEDESGHGGDAVVRGRVLCLIHVHLEEHLHMTSMTEKKTDRVHLSVITTRRIQKFCGCHL